MQISMLANSDREQTTSYPFEKWFVGWACVGYITVLDIRANVDSFYTDFRGKPDLKIGQLEKSASKDMKIAKELVDQETGVLTFTKLKQISGLT